MKKGCKSRYGPLLTNIETVGNLYGYQGQPSQAHWGLLDSNVNKLHKTYALGMMHKQQFIEHSSGMLPKYIWFLIPFLIFCFKFY